MNEKSIACQKCKQQCPPSEMLVVWNVPMNQYYRYYICEVCYALKISKKTDILTGFSRHPVYPVEEEAELDELARSESKVLMIITITLSVAGFVVAVILL